MSLDIKRTPVKLDVKFDVRDALLKMLRKAMKERPLREEMTEVWVTGRATPESVPAWVVHERRQMLLAVNRRRAEYALPPAAMVDIEMLERMSTGHVDYAEKFALYCAELALGEEGR